MKSIVKLCLELSDIHQKNFVDHIDPHLVRFLLLSRI